MVNPVTFMTFGFITLVALSCVVAIFKMKYDTTARLATRQAETDSSYRDLAAQALKAQEANSALLSDIASRLAVLEKLLKDVG
jgi:hypothetical protein